MQAWLLFPIRLIVIALMAAVVYFACDAVEQRLAMRPVEDSVDDTERTEAVKPKLVHFIPPLVGIVAFIGMLGAAELAGVKRFRKVVEQIDALGGRVEFNSERKTSLAQYWAMSAAVDLSDATIDDASFPDLKYMPNLTALKLTKSKVGGNAFEKLRGCHRLERLDLSQTELSDGDLYPLHRLKNLRDLVVSDLRITDASVGDLSLVRSLTTLELSGTAITEDGRRQLAKALPEAAILNDSITC